MSQVANHLAELTAFRDRDLVDTTLGVVLRDRLRSSAVAICHVLSESPHQHRLTRARMQRNEVAAQSDPMCVDLEALPALDACPDRPACLQQQEPPEAIG